MAKINRLDGNVIAFSSGQQANERFVFGSSSVVSDELTDQYTAEAIRGWGTVGPSEFPPLQWFNSVAFTSTQFSAYLHQMGVAEWNVSQEYYMDSFVNRNGVLYKSKSNANTGNTPESSSEWVNAVMEQSLLTRVGQRAEIHSLQIPDWLLKADGSIVSRTVDDVLWAHASTSGLVIAQTIKDANPEQYAMYYGDGDGSTTFSLPNWYLGHFARGNPSGVALGDTLGDAIRNITGSASTFYRAAAVSSAGVLGSAIYGGTPAKVGAPGVDPGANYNIDIDVSRQVPTASENRPKSGHINVCIERGKIPS